jgi:hypothetical protein
MPRLVVGQVQGRGSLKYMYCIGALRMKLATYSSHDAVRNLPIEKHFLDASNAVFSCQKSGHLNTNHRVLTTCRSLDIPSVALNVVLFSHQTQHRLGKVKLSVRFTRHHAFLTSALDVSEWSASRPCHFNLGGKTPVPIGLNDGWAPQPVQTRW